MPFSHHSHSGQFCCHAKDTLESIVQTAIQKEMQTLALTEHMPREDSDLYPEEVICLFHCRFAPGLIRHILDRKGLETARTSGYIQLLLPGSYSFEREVLGGD